MASSAEDASLDRAPRRFSLRSSGAATEGLLS